EHFYFIWPPLMVLLGVRGRVGVLLGCLIWCFAVRWVILLLRPELTSMAELWTFTRLDAIGAGCLLAALACHRSWRTRLDRTIDWWPVVLLVLLGSLVLSKISGKWQVGAAYSLNSASIACLMWAAARKPPRWLNQRVVVAVGIGSYSIYLWQQLFLN